jgi:hypothetical protein
MRHLTVLLLALVAALSLIPGAHAEGDDPARAVAEALVERMIAAERGVKDAVYTLHRREWADGGLIPEERMAIKWRRGGDVYMRWVGERYNGREVLYSPTLTGGKLIVSTAALCADAHPRPQRLRRHARQPPQHPRRGAVVPGAYGA